MIHRIRNVFSLPVQLILIIAGAVWLTPHMPEVALQGALALSLTLKSFLMCFLPFLIFSYLFSSLSQMSAGALSFIITLFCVIFIMNFLPCLASYGIGTKIIQYLDFKEVIRPSNVRVLKPLWNLTAPQILPNESGLIMGLVSGLCAPFIPAKLIERTQKFCLFFTSKFLNKFFLPLVPFFILGFIVQLVYEEMLACVYKQYGPLLLCIVAVQFLYSLLLYLLAAQGALPQASKYIKNMLSPALTSITTMSSAAALPLTIAACRANTQNSTMVNAIVPITVNTHLSGDNISVPLLALGIFTLFMGHTPSFDMYLELAFYLAILKFAIAPVPGGGIVVMLPALERYFGFTSEMSGLILTVYLLFDPLNTGFNVFGNGAFAILFQKMWSRLRSEKAR